MKKPAGGAARPAVEERGELSLHLDGTNMVLRPSWEAIDAFEKATGRGLIDLARDAIAGKLRVGEIAQIACECVRAFGRDTGDDGMARAGTDRIATLILNSDAGVHGANGTIAGMLAMATTGGYTALGEVKPTTKTTTTSGAPVVG